MKTLTIKYSDDVPKRFATALVELYLRGLSEMQLENDSEPPPMYHRTIDGKVFMVEMAQNSSSSSTVYVYGGGNGEKRR